MSIHGSGVIIETKGPEEQTTVVHPTTAGKSLFPTHITRTESDSDDSSYCSSSSSTSSSSEDESKPVLVNSTSEQQPPPIGVTPGKKNNKNTPKKRLRQTLLPRTTTATTSSGSSNTTKKCPRREEVKHPTVAAKSPKYVVVPPQVKRQCEQQIEEPASIVPIIAKNGDIQRATREQDEKKNKKKDGEEKKNKLDWTKIPIDMIPEDCKWKSRVRGGFTVTKKDGRRIRIEVGQFVLYGTHPALVLDATNEEARHTNTFRLRMYEYIENMNQVPNTSCATTQNGHKKVAQTNDVCTLGPKDANIVKPACIDDASPECDYVVAQGEYGYAPEIRPKSDEQQQQQQHKTRKQDAKTITDTKFEYVWDDMFETKQQREDFLEKTGITSIPVRSRYQHELENNVSHPIVLKKSTTQSCDARIDTSTQDGTKSGVLSTSSSIQTKKTEDKQIEKEEAAICHNRQTHIERKRPLASSKQKEDGGKRRRKKIIQRHVDKEATQKPKDDCSCSIKETSTISEKEHVPSTTTDEIVLQPNETQTTISDGVRRWRCIIDTYNIVGTIAKELDFDDPTGQFVKYASTSLSKALAEIRCMKQLVLDFGSTGCCKSMTDVDHQELFSTTNAPRTVDRCRTIPIPPREELYFKEFPNAVLSIVTEISELDNVFVLEFAVRSIRRVLCEVSRLKVMFLTSSSTK